MAVSDQEVTNVNTATAVVYRHKLSTRIWHWLNAVVILIMLMSGLMIFNAHPRLYWGQYGANFDHAWLQIGTNELSPHLPPCPPISGQDNRHAQGLQIARRPPQNSSGIPRRLKLTMPARSS
jgi:hypothetical protein